jgi:hypothetical protein
MSFMHKKYETPIELHRILGNTYAADQAEKTEIRKQVTKHALTVILTFWSPLNIFATYFPEADDAEGQQTQRNETKFPERTVF